MVLAALPIVIIFYAVFKKDKTVGALVQQVRLSDSEWSHVKLASGGSARTLTSSRKMILC